VTDVVQQGGRPDDGLLILADRDGRFGLAKERQRAPGEMVRAEGVLEPRVRRTRINEIRPAKLPNVAQALKDFGVDELQCQLVDSDVVPDGVAQDLEVRAPFIAAGSR
jgi:hypothetical protein